MNKNDGGPAFPVLVSLLERQYRSEADRFTHDAKIEGGMSLRDWFAGQVLMGMHARATFDEAIKTPQRRAANAYGDADAMLAERSKEITK